MDIELSFPLCIECVIGCTEGQARVWENEYLLSLNIRCAEQTSHISHFFWDQKVNNFVVLQIDNYT